MKRKHQQADASINAKITQNIFQTLFFFRSMWFAFVIFVKRNETNFLLSKFCKFICLKESFLLLKPSKKKSKHLMIIIAS